MFPIARYNHSPSARLRSDIKKEKAFQQQNEGQKIEFSCNFMFNFGIKCFRSFDYTSKKKAHSPWIVQKL